MQVTLQHNCTDKNLRYVNLREMNGYDEMRLAATRDSPFFLQSIALLQGVAGFPEGVDAEEVLPCLSVGDRVLLMLHMRRMTLGDTMHCILKCPACRVPMSIELSASTFIDSAVKSALGQTETGEIKPVTTEDQKMLLLSAGGINAAAAMLLKSCALSHDRSADDAEQALKQIDPLADIVLDLSCPECGQIFQAPFDPEAFFLTEVATRSAELEKEVHWLAFHYHWSEDAILSLPASRRRRYLDLINDTLSAGEGT